MTRGLPLVLALALGLRLLFFCGLRGSDDLRYAALANAHAAGAPLIPKGASGVDFGAVRPAFTGGVSLAVSGFALSEASLMAYPMLCSLGLCALLYLAALKWLGKGAALATGLIAAALPGFVVSASSLYPDLPMALWSAAGLVLLWGASEWGRPAALASGAAFALAGHHKETAALLLPVLLWLACTRPRRALAPWLLLGLGAGALLPWGGYAARKLVEILQGLEAGSVASAAPARAALNTSSPLGRRLLWDFTEPLLSPLRPGPFSMWAGIAWLAAGGAWLAVRERSNPLLACAAWGSLAFLALDAFGMPGKGYYPLHPVSPRYLALVMPPFVLLAGAFSAWAWVRLGRLKWAAGALAAAGLLAMNAATASPNQGFGRVLRRSAEVLGSAPAGEVWTDRRTAEGLSLLHPRMRIRILEPGDPAPPGGFLVVNGPVLARLAADLGDPLPAWYSGAPEGWERIHASRVTGLRDDPGPGKRMALYRKGGAAGLLAAASPRASSEITPRQRVVVTLMGVGLILFIFELVRRRRLREEYSWLWMLSGAVILFFALCDPALLWITALIGAGLPTTSFFFFGLFFLILISIHYAVKISTLTTHQKNLMQEIALLKERLEREKRP